MRVSKDALIIHLFATLHATIALCCRLVEVTDDVMLTLLTMLMVVILCLRRQVSVVFVALAVIAVNIAGYVIGIGLAKFLSVFLDSPLLIFPASTFVCTETIGWTTLHFVNIYKRNWEDSPSSPSARSLRWLFMAFVVVTAVRLILVLPDDYAEPRNLVIDILLDYTCCCAALLWLAEYAIRTRERAEKEREKANLAQYRYLKLKQQVNPHFLFNSLNVLDCMIQEQSPEEASEYTHKLAEIYRYMIKNEDETIVRLRDEMEFVSKFMDLLRIRFPEGLKINVDIPETLMSRGVVPCCVQLLIENATKHNAARRDNPLVIDIKADKNGVTVSNNLCPKVTRTSSTGLGLKYIRRQYEDLSGKSISVKETDGRYTVTLPLL